MSSNYSGVATATEAPAAQAAPGVVPIVNIPADGDALAASSVAQMAKVSADYIAYLEQRVKIVWDHFLGDQLNRGAWAGAATAGATLVQDNSGLGALSLATTAVNTAPGITTNGLLLGTNNIRLRFRVRYTTLNTGASVFLGLDDGGGNLYGFYTQNGVNSGHWNARIGAANNDATDAPSTTYQVLEMRVNAGNIYFFVNGVQRFTTAFATSMLVSLKLNAGYSSANATFLVDYVDLDMS